MCFQESGQIRHEDYELDENIVWQVNTNCTNVEIKSAAFAIEDGWDFLRIEDETYTGNDVIDQQVPANFEVTFTSDEMITDTGFILDWNCI